MRTEFLVFGCFKVNPFLEMSSAFKAPSGLLPQKFAAVILFGPAYDKFLLPVHVLFGEPMAAAGQNTSNVKRLEKNIIM